MRMYDLIQKKRDGGELSEKENIAAITEMLREKVIALKDELAKREKGKKEKTGK